MWGLALTASFIQCNNPTPAVIAIEKALAVRYEQRLAEHAKELEKWEDAAFAAHTSQTSEANFDVHRFIAKYFLDGDGRPDPQKTPEPITLDSVVRHVFFPAIQSVPGLAAHPMDPDRLVVVGWKSQLDRGVEKAFARIDSLGTPMHVPTMEANFDLDRFFAKYFLDGVNGKPAPAKTPEPVRLDSFFRNKGRLYSVYGSIPGLNIVTADNKYGSMITFLGWDSAKIKSQVADMAAERAKKEEEEEAKKRAEEEKKWNEAIEPHLMYKVGYNPPTGPLTLEGIVGSYIVMCETIQNGWDTIDALTLDICKPDEPDTTLAAFDFGPLEGTMLLAMSEDAVHKRRQILDATPEDSEGEGEYDVYGEPLAAEHPPTPPKPRLAINRRLGEAPRPGRVYLNWAGRETGEGEIEVSYDDSPHDGYLDFNESRLTAQGVLRNISFIGKEVELSLFKVADTPSKEPEEWSYLGERRHDYEASARWGGWVGRWR